MFVFSVYRYYVFIPKWIKLSLVDWNFYAYKHTIHAKKDLQVHVSTVLLDNPTITTKLFLTSRVDYMYQTIYGSIFSHKPSFEKCHYMLDNPRGKKIVQ